METRLIAVDLDGTLLRSDRTLSPATIDAVAAASARGLEVVFASGRALCEFDRMLEQLPQIRYAVASTGTQVIRCPSGEELYSESLSLDLVREGWRRLRHLEVMYEVYWQGKIWAPAERVAEIERYEKASGNCTIHESRTPVEHYDRWIDQLEGTVPKVHMYFPTPAVRDEARALLAGMDAYICTSDPVDLEMMPAGVDKGTGLAKLAQLLGLAREQVMAIGDSGNDLGMLRYAGTAVVMGNGSEEAKALASYLTDTNDNDGVAKVLNSLPGVGGV